LLGFPMDAVASTPRGMCTHAFARTPRAPNEARRPSHARWLPQVASSKMRKI
jgi:ribosomal protein S12